jgi:hypothetical protein
MERVVRNIGEEDPLATRLRSLNPETIYQELECSGIYCIDSAVPENLLHQLREAVAELVAHRGQASFSLIQPWKTIRSFAKLAESCVFLGLLRSLSLRARNKHSVAASEIYNVLRVITGPMPDEEPPLLFHYDATVITALVPIFIPPGEAEQAGDFVCFPNIRPIRNFVLINLLEKSLMQNPLTRFLFARKARLRRPSAKIIRLVPGNIYLFWGYRTYHANFSCLPNTLRATLLFHFGDPHLGSAVTRTILAVRRWRVNRRIRPDLIDASNAAER